MAAFSRIMKWMIAGGVVAGLPRTAASQGDTASAIRAIAVAVLRENATGPRDHQGPFVLGAAAVESWKPWVAMLEAEFRKARPNVLATPAANVLRVDVGPLRRRGDTTLVVISYNRCTEGSFWSHGRTLFLLQSSAEWVTSWGPEASIAHGVCSSQAAANFVGTWELQTVLMQTAGDSLVPVWGDRPVGRLVYDAQSRMFALLMPAARNQAAGGPPIPEALAREVAGYYGSYSVDTARRVVTHHVRTSLRAAESRSIERSYLFHGTQLVLSAKATRDGAPVTYILTWQRLEP